MVKTQIIIFLILILYSFQQSNNNVYSSKCTNVVPDDKYDCFDIETEDFEDLGMHCCHRTNTYTNGKTDYECEFFQENDDYDDIDGFIASEMNRNSDYKDIKIDCFQKYISYNLALLIAFLFVIN